ncbi:MAG: class I SAM-dependent methyltransferase [Patescibacteria group bacterium]
MWDRYYASDSGSWFFAKVIHWGREAYFGKLFARRVRMLGGEAVSYLELGVGTAQTLTRLQKMTNAPCTGIEKTPRAHELGKLTAPNCTLVLGDALALPFPEQSFDVIYSLGLFEHFEPEEQRQLLSEQARVAKKMILIEVPTKSPHMRSIMWFNRVVRKRKGVWADDELFSQAHFKEKFPGLPFRYYFDWGSGAMTCWFALKPEDVKAFLNRPQD